jgi:hypothetical protein
VWNVQKVISEPLAEPDTSRASETEYAHSSNIPIGFAFVHGAESDLDRLCYRSLSIPSRSSKQHHYAADAVHS